MSFAYPSFLWALLAVAIPVIIHLFYFRRFKTVYFTNVKFLKEVKEETSSRSRLKHLLVLTARVLTVAFLVFAFAQPFIPGADSEGKSGARDVSIYIDNSYSMSSRSEDVPLLEKAKQRAREIVSNYSIEDQFQILTTDLEGRDQRLLSKEDAISRLEEIQPGFHVEELEKVLTRQKQALRSGTHDQKVSFMISDFQKISSALKPYQDSTIDLKLIPMQSVERRNVALDSIWFEGPVQMLNQTNPLIVKVRNLSDAPAENVRISLSLNNQIKPSGILNIPANSVAYDTINFTIIKTGWHEAKVSVTDYPIEFDDDYYFSFYVREHIDILQIYEGKANTYINAAYKNNSYFREDALSVNQLDYSKFSDYELIILSELNNLSSGLIAELKTFIENGGNVLVFPGKSVNLQSYKTFTKTFRANTYEARQAVPRVVANINRNEFIFSDVYEKVRDNLKLPATQSNYKMARSGGAREEVLLRYRDGGSYLSKFAIKKGNLYLCASDLELSSTDLVQRGEVFIPLLYKAALAGGKMASIAYTIGKDNILETDNRVTDQELVYKLKGTEREFIPQQKAIGSKVILNLNNEVQESGYYNLFLDDNKILDKFAFNYDRKESALDYYSIEELKTNVGDAVSIIDGSKVQDFEALIGERIKGTQLWKWCLILCLVFLGLETLLLRFWKT